MLVDSQLSNTVLNILLRRVNQFDDLVFYDRQLYQSLRKLTAYVTSPDADKIFESIGLTFEVRLVSLSFSLSLWA